MGTGRNTGNTANKAKHQQRNACLNFERHIGSGRQMDLETEDQKIPLNGAKSDASRRAFLRSAVFGAAAATPGLTLAVKSWATMPWARTSQDKMPLQPERHHPAAPPITALGANDASPIQTIVSPSDPGRFTGDQPRHAHDVLWNKAKFLAERGGIPAPTESARVVILGGGISGLAAAYQLRDLAPILLEQNPCFGGNAKGERWGSLAYSTGSAYLAMPETGTPLAKLLQELGLLDRLRIENANEEAALLLDPNPSPKTNWARARKIVAPFWAGATDPKRKDDFKRVFNELTRIGREAYPAIPAESAGGSEHLRKLDELSFSDWAQAHLAPLHPHIEELFHEYCWDSLGGTTAELSAAQVLNFLTADMTSGMCALPGGNAAVATALFEKLSSELPQHCLRANSLAIDVTATERGVRICYESASGELRTIEATACVVAAPKFVARRIVSGLPHDQLEAMTKLRYRAFTVANVFLKKKVPSPHYGVFQIRSNVPHTDEPRAFTSMIFASWAAHDRADHSALTLYRGFPMNDGRARLSSETAYAEVRSQLEAELPSLLPAVGADLSQFAGLRIARLGHALPLAARGLLADGTLERASRPVAGRIFFGQQDNWANPCMESAVNAAYAAALSARRKT